MNLKRWKNMSTIRNPRRFRSGKGRGIIYQKDRFSWTRKCFDKLPTEVYKFPNRSALGENYERIFWWIADSSDSEKHFIRWEYRMRLGVVKFENNIYNRCGVL